MLPEHIPVLLNKIAISPKRYLVFFFFPGSAAAASSLAAHLLHDGALARGVGRQMPRPAGADAEADAKCAVKKPPQKKRKQRNKTWQ